MKRIFVLLLIFLASSCQYFNAKKIASEDILNEELKTFNWNAVDTYPSFSVCDTFETKSEKKTCFENTLSQHITLHLQEEIIVVSQDINDTIVLKLQISEKGLLSLENIKLDSITQSEIPNIETLLSNNLNTLPKIFPAIKRDQPVKTQFSLPIIITAN